MGKYLLILTMVLLCSCTESPEPPLARFSGSSMTMEWRVHIGNLVQNPQEVEKLIESSFRTVNQTYNKWNPRSELSTLNQLKAHTPFSISPDLAKFLVFTEKFVTLSNGRFDPTIEPLQRLWKDKLSKNQVPQEAEITPLIKAVGWKEFSVKDGLFTKNYDETSFDLGAIAKGYAVDLILEKIVGAGYSNVYVEWGGEMRAVGHHPSGRPWTVWISRLNDTDPEHALDTVILDGQGLATSGDYQQFWVYRNQEGIDTTYFHVIDPVTGYPLSIKPESIASVSVLAPTCAIADALATSAMLFPTLNEAETWAKKVQETYPTVRFWFITR